MTEKTSRYVLGAVMFWTVTTTLFAWLPLVRIMGRPEGYTWSILGLSGNGLTGPFWIFVPLTMYAVTLLFTAARGPRSIFHPMLLIWHFAVTSVVVIALALTPNPVLEGQGLHFEISLWLLVVPFVLFLCLAIAWVVADRKSGDRPLIAPWSKQNTTTLLVSLAGLVAALVLFRLGTNYNWVTAIAIITTVGHWLLLCRAFEPIKDIAESAVAPTRVDSPLPNEVSEDPDEPIYPPRLAADLAT